MLGEVTLTSGAKAQYYVDAKRAILLPDVFIALGVLSPSRRTPVTRSRSAACP